jgi:hypothetical protein
VVMEWWGLAAGVLGLVLGILALLRRDTAAQRPSVVQLPEPEVEAEVQEWVIDLSGKARHREESVAEWNRMFMDALGEDREAFVKEWAEGSERLALSRQLRADEEEARRKGGDNTKLLWALGGLRHELTKEPERAMSEEELDEFRRFRLRVLAGPGQW